MNVVQSQVFESLKARLEQNRRNPNVPALEERSQGGSDPAVAQSNRRDKRFLKKLKFSSVKVFIATKLSKAFKNTFKPAIKARQAAGMSSQYNTLIVHIIRVRDVPTKNGRALDSYCSLNLIGHSKFRAKVDTNTTRLENGVCDWNEHLEFNVNETFSELLINIKYKAKLGNAETLATKSFRLADMPKTQSAKWYDLHKKGKEDMLRGQILMSYEFSNQFNTSISQFSLNEIEKENKMDKFKRHIPFRNKKKAQLDRASMASYAISRRSSICSNSSAIAFSPIASPHPQQELQFESPQSTPSDPHPAFADVPLNRDVSARSSAMLSAFPNPKEDTISQYSMNIAEENANPDSGKKNFATKLRQKADKLLNRNHNRQSVLSVDDNLDEANSKRHSRAQSIASSSGFASNGGPGILDDLSDNTSKEHLLNVIRHLRKELQLKENRIRDLEEYTGGLLSRIMESNPDLLQVPPIK
ncbi:unnamed protein product [Bursaphelenchus xylophilus]|uniref:(pine wood nematode) hypothetical protein n=1 Tax=Bursaphelenchus xylophilus TaxID=6326 RepID=A0A1I7SCT7_BURXY|nr:unnamed protein product [Bursaphelenchus xylophilus]CAG9093514.1 unnamed protein product [Bursaphelenchus xylophilus]